MVLPSEQVSGRACVAISARATWLRNLLGGTSTQTSHVQAILNFVQECVLKFGSSSTDAPKPTSQEEEPASSHEASRKRGRQRVFDSDDEAQLASSQVCQAEKTMSRTPRHRKVKRGEFVQVSLRGFSLVFTVHSGPKIMVPLERDFLQRVVDDLLPRRGEARSIDVCVSTADKVREEMTPEERGRLIWRPPSLRMGGRWLVRYVDDAGQVRSTSRGLQVPQLSIDGEPMCDEEQRRTLLGVLKKAKREWNRLDQSDEDRFVL